MSGRSGGGGGRRRRGYGANGFEEFGGYMAAKVAKLEDQYDSSVTLTAGERGRRIFHGIAIFVNGYTEPTAEELKRIMMANGGTYHHYFSRSKTTHIIANNLPDAKIKNMNTDKIVSPKWITDSLEAGHLLNYTKYILYTNQSRSQPGLPFRPISVSKEKLNVSRKYSTSVPISEGKPLIHDTLNFKEVNSGPTVDKSIDPDKVSTETSFISGAKNEIIPRRQVNSIAKSDETRCGVTSTSSHNYSPVKSHSMSTANPGFLSEFYNNSRLHHISTMGAVFKQYVNELQNKNEDFSGRIGLMEWVNSKCKGEKSPAGGSTTGASFGLVSKKSNKRTVMHIDMDCFFVSVGLRKHPELRGKPIAVTHAKGNPKSQVREGMDRQYELNYYKERAEKRLQTKMRPFNAAKSTNADVAAECFDEDNIKESDKTPVSVVVPASNKKFSTISLIDDTSSMSEIASCSYEARKMGVRNGMFLGPALKLCPDLQTIPYDFDGYKEVSYKLYDIVASFTHDIEAVSCDEMFVELTELIHTCQVTSEDFATYLREQIKAATGCPCSAGMGPNMLVARLATRLAKPNGQHLADPNNLPHYMKDQKVTELPGVGWSLGKRLESEGIHTCGDLQTKPLHQLQSTFGARTGQSLYNYCRGIDDRPLKSGHVRKSVSAEVNYGIRFTCHSDAEKFINELAEEVENRLNAVKVKGKCITLKLKIRAKDAPVETAKFMGHGVCDNVAKSVSLASATSSASVIGRETLSLLRQVKAHPQDFRGVGIQVSRLEGHHGPSGGSGSSCGSSIKSFLLAAKSNKTKMSLSSNTKLRDSPEKHQLSNTDVKDLMDSANGSSKLQPERTGVGPPQTLHTQPGLNTGQDLSVADEQVPSVSKTEAEGKGSIDLEVLNALPDDIRDQVIAEYKQEGYIIPSVDGGVSKDEVLIDDEPKPSTSGYIGLPRKTQNQESASKSIPMVVYRNDRKDVLRENTSMSDGENGLEEIETESKTSKERVKSTIQEMNRNSYNNSSEIIATRQTANLVTVDGDSNSSFVSDVQDEALITSFSQVDSSFLEAIPEELREELRLDFERQKQAAVAVSTDAAAPSFLTDQNLTGSPSKDQRSQGSPSKDKRSHRAETTHRRGTMGKRGRWGKIDPRKAEAEGQITLTCIMTGQLPGRTGNSSDRRVISADKKKSKQPKSKIPGCGTNTSPVKRPTHAAAKEGPSLLRSTNFIQNAVTETSSMPSTSGEGSAGKANTSGDGEEVPQLCGVEKLSELKSLIREWVLSCSQPEAEDANILASYYTNLISHHDLEKVDLLIKYLYRQVLRTQNKLWESAYQTVINRVQTAMQELYQVKLKVPLI